MEARRRHMRASSHEPAAMRHTTQDNKPAPTTVLCSSLSRLAMHIIGRSVETDHADAHATAPIPLLSGPLSHCGGWSATIWSAHETPDARRGRDGGQGPRARAAEAGTEPPGQPAAGWRAGSCGAYMVQLTGSPPRRCGRSHGGFRHGHGPRQGCSHGMCPRQWA